MVFGTENLSVSNENVQRRVVSGSSVTEHPYFDPFTGAYDLSVIELAEPVEINSKSLTLNYPMLKYASLARF